MLAYRRHETTKLQKKEFFCLWQNCSHNVNTTFRVLVLTEAHKASREYLMSYKNPKYCEAESSLMDPKTLLNTVQGGALILQQ